MKLDKDLIEQFLADFTAKMADLDFICRAGDDTPSLLLKRTMTYALAEEVELTVLARYFCRTSSTAPSSGSETRSRSESTKVIRHTS